MDCKYFFQYSVFDAHFDSLLSVRQYGSDHINNFNLSMR